MFESFSYSTLQHYWWAIISLLGSCLVFLLFVQGGQTLLYSLARNEDERSLLVNSLGRKWELTFTTLVTFGGAFFASFPLFYSTSFGGAYWVWMAILFCFVIQAISYEYRSKPDNLLGARTYEIFLFINGALGTILLGTAIATFFTGSNFSVDFANLTRNGNTAISRWENGAHGLEAALNLHNLSLGFSVFFLSRALAILYFMNTVESESIMTRARKALSINGAAFLLLFLSFTVALMVRKGFAIDPGNGMIIYEKSKYLHNLIEMPVTAVLFLTGTLLVISGMLAPIIRKGYSRGIWFSGAGTVAVVMSLFLIAAYNNTAYYPSVFDLQSSLTIFNSSSSEYTLTVMSYVSLFVPFVIAYIAIAWKFLGSKKITLDELKTETHKY